MTVEQETTGTEASRFPFITLAKALERALVLHKAAGQHAALVSDLPKLWGYADKASGWRQTIAALKYYGLLTDSGSKDRRRVKLSDDARRYFLDERPEVHEDLNRKFALLPRALSSLWAKWRASPPADSIARSTLKIEFGYAENAAAELLNVYKANLAFAKLIDPRDDSRTTAPATPSPPQEAAPVVPPPASVKVGDYVQWTSAGVDQFPQPKKVVAFLGDGYAQVFGHSAGLPVSELTVVDAPALAPVTVKATPRTGSSAYAGRDGDLNVLLRGNRLEITADVDRAGIARLKEILGKYEEILDLIEAPPQ